MPDSPFDQVISELANALQAATPLSTRLRRRLAEQSQDAVTLEAAIDRAVRAVRELRPRGEGGAR
jgi:hypothetical protein